MSHLSRLYNHRNAQTPESKKEGPFFSKKHADDTKSKATFFQAKLSVNKPGDKYEQEADTVANKVVNNTIAKPLVQQKQISNIQRLSTSTEDEIPGTNDARMKHDKDIQRAVVPEKEKDKKIQKMDAAEKDEEGTISSIQQKSTNDSSGASPQLSSRIEQTSGKGKSLPKNTLHEMNTSFGVNFNKVNIHTNSEATDMNKELSAHAFTHGSDIYFNAGKFDPASVEGKRLLAHELTHVVQQTGDLNTTNIQKDDDNTKDPSYRDPLAVQPGGPLDMNDQSFTLKRSNDGKWEGCGPVPGGAGGSDNACVSADSIDQIKNYFKKKPSTLIKDRPANCPPERWNLPLNYCCPPDKHIDPNNKFNCVKVEEQQAPIPPPVPSEKGDFEVPDSDTKYA